MDLEAFEQSVESGTPPAGLSAALRGLWEQARGDWEAAHVGVQDDPGRDAAWVHAHLHRVEGDESNAGYWYRRADRPHSHAPLDEEWREITGALLGP